MKKALSVLLLLAMVFCCACAEEGNWYLETARNAVLVLSDLVSDEAYLEMMSSQSFDEIEKLKGVDFGAVTSAYRYTSFDAETIESMFYLMGGELSEAGMEMLSSRFPQTILSLQAGSLGAEVLAVSSMLTYSYTDVMPYNFEPCFVLLSLDSAAASVSFCQTGDSTITVQAQPFFFNDDQSAEDAVQGFTPYDMPVFPIVSEKLL